MKKTGGYLLLFGIGSIILLFVDMEFMLLMWVDNWGIEIGWAIRITMIITGILLLIFGKSGEDEEDEDDDEDGD